MLLISTLQYPSWFAKTRLGSKVKCSNSAAGADSQLAAGADIRERYPTVRTQPEAVCESTFRRACTALLAFPAYFRQNASTAFIRRRFSVVT